MQYREMKWIAVFIGLNYGMSWTIWWVTRTYHSIEVVNVVLQDLKYKLLNEIIITNAGK